MNSLSNLTLQRVRYRRLNSPIIPLLIQCAPFRPYPPQRHHRRPRIPLRPRLLFHLFQFGEGGVRDLPFVAAGLFFELVEDFVRGRGEGVYF